MSRGIRTVHAALGAFAFVASCTVPRTEIVVSVHTDIVASAPDALRALKVTVRAGDAQGPVRWQSVQPLAAERDGAADDTFLMRFGLLPLDNDTSRVAWVEVAGCRTADCAQIAVAQRVTVSFVPQETRFLRLDLTRACFDDCPFGNINMIDQFEISPSNVELTLNGPPAEMTLSGVRMDRVKEVIVTIKGPKGSERAPGIDASLGGGKHERKIVVRATGSEVPDAKAKIALVLRLDDGSIVDFPSGSGGIKVKAAGEKAEIKAGSKAVKVKASTCDLCTGLDMPSCVYACPHDAAMRVFPAEFFANGAPFDVMRQGPQPGDIDRRTTHIKVR